MKVFVTRIIPCEIEEKLTSEGFEVEQWTEKRNLTDTELIDKCRDADALFSIGSTNLGDEILSELKHLKVIALNSVGYDIVDLKAANKYRIPIGNTPGVLSKATADMAFLLMQNVARKSFFHHRELLSGNTGFLEPLENVGFSLEGKTLGIFGLGRIGYEMGKVSQRAFGMKIIYFNRSNNAEAEADLGARKVTFEELLAQSDVLSLHANLSSETEGKFNRDAFSQMKKSAIFINTARGAMHIDTDLHYALENRLIWGAGLDVTNPEPMQKDNPLLTMPNTAILPHIGSNTFETRMKMMELCVANLSAGLRGERLPFIVNPEVYDNDGIYLHFYIYKRRFCENYASKYRGSCSLAVNCSDFILFS